MNIFNFESFEILVYYCGIHISNDLSNDNGETNLK